MRQKITTLESLPDIMTPQHVADYLGISRRRVYEYCQLKASVGGLPSFKIGESRKIEKASLIQWIEAQKQVQHCS
ncbi:MAG: DNA-binding protein [Bacilli bacterium]|nr:DNA-binding protein [Bacilli bacterium]